MKAKLLSLNTDKSMSFSRYQARIDSSLKSYTGDKLDSYQFENIRDIFAALQEALENDELIITAVDVKNYLRFKNALIQAFGNDATYAPAVLNKLERMTELEDKVRKAFSIFPEAATVFVSDDGLYSGFGLENGSQCVLCLPIDNNRIDGILRNGVIPFLSDSFEVVGVDAEISKAHTANQEKVALAVKRILDTNSLVAVNGTTNAETLKSCGDSVEGFSDAFVFTPHVEDKGNVNATEYAAQLAKVSLDLSAANIGACISDIYTSGDVSYICIAVASEESAVVRKLYMSENETESAFIESAALELVELIGEKATGIRSVGIEITDEPMIENIITEKDKKSVGKKPLIVLAVIMSLVIVACVVFGVLYAVKGEDFFSSMFQPKEEQTTEALKTEEPTKEEEELIIPEYVTPILPISEYIGREYLLNPVINNIAPSGATPQFISINGKNYDTKEGLAKLVAAEIDVNDYEVEAVKAQVVVIYSYLKYRNNGYVIDNVLLADTYPEELLTIVESVFGQYIAIGNNVALTPYHLVSAGRTMDLQFVSPYLSEVSVANTPELSFESTKAVKKISEKDMKLKLLTYDKTMSLSSNPEEWIQIIRHDAAISSDVGYVYEIKVAGKTYDGPFLRVILGEDVIASGCYDIDYDANTQTFVITTYGQGYGVGMSLTGAKYMAENGSDYKTILSTYYVGTTVAVEG